MENIKQLRQEIRKSQKEVAETLRKAVNIMLGETLLEEVNAMAIVYHAQTGEIINANQRILNYLGYTKEEFVGNTFLHFAVEKDETAKAHADFLKGKMQSTFFHNHYICKDGSHKPMYWPVDKSDRETNIPGYFIALAYPSLDVWG